MLKNENLSNVLPWALLRHLTEFINQIFCRSLKSFRFLKSYSNNKPELNKKTLCNHIKAFRLIKYSFFLPVKISNSFVN